MLVRRTLLRSGRLLALTLALAIGGATGLHAAEPAHAVPAAPNPEQAAAIARAAMVLVEVRWHGWVRARATGNLIFGEEIAVTSRCSGFVVSPDGYIVTSGFCPNPGMEGAAMLAFNQLASKLIVDGKLKEEQRIDYIVGLRNSADFTAGEAKSSPAGKVYIQQAPARADDATEHAREARVLGVSPPEQGNVAILKVDKSPLPAIEINTGDISAGADLTAVGFHSEAPDVPSATYTLQTNPVTVVSAPGADDNRITLGSPTGETAIGGALVDRNGRLVGMLMKHFQDEWHYDAATPTGVIAAKLQEFGGSHKLSEADVTFRNGLTHFYAGDYSAAIKDFDTVIAAVPNNAEAKSYRERAFEQLVIKGSGESGSWLTIALAAALGAIVTAAIVAFVFMMTRRARRRGMEDGVSLVLPTSFNPFASTSTAPVSGGYGYNPFSVSGPPAAEVDLPVPRPPIQLPRTDQQSEAHVEGSDAEYPVERTEVVPAPEPAAQATAPAVPPAPPTPSLPESTGVIWPEDDDAAKEPQPESPWSPPRSS